MEGRHAELLSEAVACDGEAFRAMFDERPAEARDALRRAVELYRQSWEAAPPGGYGRLVALMKSAVLAGDGEAAAAWVRGELGGEAGSPTSAYALALVALVEGDDREAAAAAATMRGGGDAFARAAAALEALAARDAAGYADALHAIVADFEGRDAHLTGVPVADTAMLMEALAAPRGMAARPASGDLRPAALTPGGGGGRGTSAGRCRA
jgi:hypothetical protein